MSEENKIQENKLPAEFKVKWLAALRSGEYKQGKSQLYNRAQDTYCCLGVACRISAPDKEIPMSGYILQVFADYENVPSIIVGASSKSIVSTLTYMNDSGKTFEEIADWIETNL